MNHLLFDCPLSCFQRSVGESFAYNKTLTLPDSILKNILLCTAYLIFL